MGLLGMMSTRESGSETGKWCQEPLIHAGTTFNTSLRLAMIHRRYGLHNTQSHAAEKGIMDWEQSLVLCIQ
jgi:hypothetical protein